MNKTVAIFNGYYLPHLGGVERYTYNISKKLRERGYNVIIVTTQHSDDLLNEEVQEGIKIYRLPVKNISFFEKECFIPLFNKENFS